MSKDDVIEVEGTVLEKLPNAMFQVDWKTVTRFWRTFPANCV